MTRTLPALMIATALALPGMARAHPHVFADAALTVVFDDQGRLAAIDEALVHDELYSLLVLTETGDPGPGGLQGGALIALAGADPNWDPVAGAALSLDRAGRPVALRSQHLSTRFEGHRLVSRRRHVPAAPVAADAPIGIRLYDPTWYVDVTMPARITLRGRRDCRVTRQPGDGTAQQSAYDSALRDALAREMGTTPTVSIGAVGADRITLTCGP